MHPDELVQVQSVVYMLMTRSTRADLVQFVKARRRSKTDDHHKVTSPVKRPKVTKKQTTLKAAATTSLQSQPDPIANAWAVDRVELHGPPCVI